MTTFEVTDQMDFKIANLSIVGKITFGNPSSLYTDKDTPPF